MRKITYAEYIEALDVVEQYHCIILEKSKQIKSKEYNHIEFTYDYAGGHFLHYITKGKIYPIIKNPYTRGWRRDIQNKEEFAIIDDNGKKRFYKYINPSGIFKLI